MRWRWWRRSEPNGAEAREAREQAHRQRSESRAQGSKVADLERTTRMLARQADLLARDVEHALRLRGST